VIETFFMVSLSSANPAPRRSQRSQEQAVPDLVSRPKSRKSNQLRDLLHNYRKKESLITAVTPRENFSALVPPVQI